MPFLDYDGLEYIQQNIYNPAKKDDSMILQVGRDEHGGLWATAGEFDTFPKYGVSGVGQSAPALTRLWDAVGKTATAGTDEAAGSSDFDDLAPFNRKKCVGNWTVSNGRAVFNVQAYQGDPDYTEDGSMGDYVAVEVPAIYYYGDPDTGTLGVSAGPHPGWEPHPVCRDKDGHVREKTYLPVYALALKDGHAVSLPGYQNHFGSYKDNWDKARTYGDGTTFRDFAIIEPSAVDHYEWMMQTIEFATQNMQTEMNGAVSMRYSADVITAAPAANKIVVTSAIGGNYVVGQTIYIGSSYGDTPSAGVSAYNCITSIEACDEDGTLNTSGSYYLIAYDGTDRTASITAGTTQLGSRPWLTGATQGYAPGVPAVLGHTGSPVSNTNGKYPMMYRWRENVYGNQNMTALDLMDVRVEDDDSYKLQWYHNPELQGKGAAAWYPSSTSAPTLANLRDESTGWELLGVETPKESYTNGYIKEEGYDSKYPHVRVPTLTKGGSATTFFCDYANLVNSHVVRAVRRRGYVYTGAYSGPRFVSAHYAPSHGSWAYGSGLYMVQQG